MSNRTTTPNQPKPLRGLKVGDRVVNLGERATIVGFRAADCPILERAGERWIADPSKCRRVR
jgi:hypothetical protein